MKLHYPSEGFAINVQYTSYELSVIQEIIKKGFERYVKSIQKKIDKIENSPKNEGQLTYYIAVKELRQEIELANELKEQLTPSNHDSN